MTSKFFATFVVVIALFLEVPAYAQKESGEIIGTVFDIEDIPLEGVKVTATLYSRESSITYTEKDGKFRFPILSPGTYELAASLEGFQTVVRKDIRLFVGNTVTINLVIGQTAGETLEISGDTPTIDATTTASSKTVPIELVENLPKFSSPIDLFTLTPGVSDLRFVAYGAGGEEANAYWFDGVDISSPIHGDNWVLPNYNWIEEVQVIGIGAPAEYGGFSGVITNSVSRSGSNEFHGLIETFFQNDSTTSSNTEDTDLSPDSVDLFSDSTIQLSGPIVLNKLWFFAGAQYFYERSQPFGYPPDGTNAFVTNAHPRAIGKLSYKPNQNNTFQGFLEWDKADLDGVQAGPFYLPEATYVSGGPEWFWNASWVSIFNAETVVDARYSGYDSRFNSTGRNGDIPQHLDANTGIRSANAKLHNLRDRQRNQLNASLSHYARDFIAGSHDFKFGIEYERSIGNTIYGYNGGKYYYDGVGLNYYDPASPNYLRYLWEGYDSFGRIRRTSVFAQDDWQVTNQINFNAGIRYDHNRAFLNESSEVQYTTTPIAPRFGVVYDVKGDQATVLKVHYGHYYDKPITFFIDGIDNFGDFTSQYWNGSEWVTFAFDPGTSAFIVDPDLKQSYVKQFTIGVDKALPGDVILKTHYIYRNFKNHIEDVNLTGEYEPVSFVNPITGEPMTLFSQTNPEEPPSLFITNPDALFRSYHAVEVYTNKRFTPQLMFTGSVVWSRSRGNTDNTANGGFSSLLNDPNELINTDGRPTFDPTWEIKVTGIYELPWKVLSSFYFRHFTGDTYTITFLTPRDLLRQGRLSINAVPRGSERLPSRNVFDFRLEKAFQIYRGDLKLTADFFNLFNTGYIYGVDSQFGSGSYLQVESFTTPREMRLGIRYQF